MIGAIFGAWLTSKPLQWALMALVALGGYEGWKYHERHIGAAKVTAAIQRQADDNAKLAEDVRNDVAAGKRGVRGKYQRPDS